MIRSVFHHQSQVWGKNQNPKIHYGQANQELYEKLIQDKS